MAIRFDASGDYLTRTASLPTITSFTMMGWVKISVDANDYQCFMALGTSAPGSSDASMFYGGTDSDGTSQMAYCPNTGQISTGGIGSMTVAKWYYAAIVVSGSGAGQFLYYMIDPATGSVSTITAAGGAVTAGYMVVGEDNYGGDNWNGCAENYLVYSAALSLADIQQQIWQRMPVRTANLNGWYPFLNDTKDYSGNGNNWTENGSLTYESGPGVAWKKTKHRVLIPVTAGGGGGDPAAAGYKSLLGVGVR